MEVFNNGDIFCKTWTNDLECRKKIPRAFCSPLTELGITQAKLLGKKLKDIKFDKFYSTSLKRANDTANYIKVTEIRS